MVFSLGGSMKPTLLFAVVKQNYKSLSQKASQSKVTRSVLPDRKVGAVWYLPGGESSVGLLYKDAHGRYAYSMISIVEVLQCLLKRSWISSHKVFLDIKL